MWFHLLHSHISLYGVSLIIINDLANMSAQRHTGQVWVNCLLDTHRVYYKTATLLKML